MAVELKALLLVFLLGFELECMMGFASAQQWDKMCS